MLRILILLVMSSDCFAKAALLVFASFSMPDASLVELTKDVNSIGGRVLIRGLVDDSFPKTINAVRRIVDQGGKTIDLDPKKFQKLNVDVVPTFVLADIEIDGTINSYDQVAGNVPLDYALEEFTKRGEHQRDARILLDQLKVVRD